jgi:hypothetical protein
MSFSSISSKTQNLRQLIFLSLLIILMVVPERTLAQPMPNSIVLLDIKSNGVLMELQLPLSELQQAFGNNAPINSECLVDRLGTQLKAYLTAHVRPVSENKKPWKASVLDLSVENAEQIATGPYRELTAHLWLETPPGASTRNFILNYDVIIHQLITHAALISIRQDWEAGIGTDCPAAFGVIAPDEHTNVIHPMHISLAERSKWKGFKSMVNLGFKHVAERTDHLMFLLVLLLPAPLVAFGKRWGNYGGTKYSVIRLLKIVTAFTIGHYITLLIGSSEWIRLPDKLVEILIAFSVLIYAVHALRPIFPGKEMYAAVGFGLIHGFAFAGTLANLNLDADQMALSLLGVNTGIELMQLFIIAVIVPSFIILSKTNAYRFIRISGAAFAGMAAIAWMVQRYSEQSNVLTTVVEKIAEQAPWIMFGIVLLAIINLFWRTQNDAVLKEI